MNYSLLTKKIGIALVELFVPVYPKINGRLIMTLQVKNEEDVLEANLLFHKKMGVDGFIVTDNDSTDRTPEIIEKYRQKGWILESVLERGKDHRQKEWVDRMIWKAKTRYKADWIINADADEFWYPETGDLKSVLAKSKANVLICGMKSMYPDDSRPLTEWGQTVSVISNPEAYGLSPYSVFDRYIPKSAHRTRGYIQVSSGNHKVIMLPKRRKVCSEICIFHYNIRGKEHFLRKMTEGGRALEQNPSKHGGRHWRYFYRLYKEGKLEEEYDRVIGKGSYERLYADGYIQENPVMKEFFERLKKE